MSEGQAAAAPTKARRNHFFVSLAIVLGAALFIGVLSYGLMLDPTKVPPANIGKPAQAFRVAWVQGQEFLPEAGSEHFDLATLKGQPLVLNFWASWCVSCRQEAHELEKFWQEHKGQVRVVGIAIQDEREAARKFAAYFGKTYMLGLDEDGKAAIDYGVSGVPETFFIDKNGIIKHKEIGPVTAAMMNDILPQIL